MQTGEILASCRQGQTHRVQISTLLLFLSYVAAASSLKDNESNTIKENYVQNGHKMSLRWALGCSRVVAAQSQSGEEEEGRALS